MENSKKIIVFYSEPNDEISTKIQGSKLFSNSLEFAYVQNLYSRIIEKSSCYCGYATLEFYPKESKRRFIVDVFTGEQSYYRIGEIQAKIINDINCGTELMDFVNKEIIRLGIDKGEFNGKAISKNRKC